MLAKAATANAAPAIARATAGSSAAAATPRGSTTAPVRMPILARSAFAATNATGWLAGDYALAADEDDGSFFIDRDGRHFHCILNYLRDAASYELPSDPATLKDLAKEAEHYGIVCQATRCAALLMPHRPAFARLPRLPLKPWRTQSSPSPRSHSIASPKPPLLCR